MIARKKCKEENCQRLPQIGMAGFCWQHLPQELKEKANSKRKAALKTQNARKATQSKLRGLKSKENEKSNLLELWFLARRHEMTGICACGCGTKSSKDDDKYFKFSAAHILAKAKFDSVKLHPLNFVELSFWGGCHSLFDDKGYDYCKKTNPKLWSIVVERFKIIYPLIVPSEHHFLPQVLLDTLP